MMQEELPSYVPVMYIVSWRRLWAGTMSYFLYSLYVSYFIDWLYATVLRWWYGFKCVFRWGCKDKG